MRWPQFPPSRALRGQGEIGTGAQTQCRLVGIVPEGAVLHLNGVEAAGAGEGPQGAL